MNMSDSAPPQQRTPLGEQMSQLDPAAGLKLQVCEDCNTVQYPPRELCKDCLGPKLAWAEVDPGGTVLAYTTLHTSLEPYFGERLPWRIGTVKLDCGPVVMTHIAAACCHRDARVQVMLAHDDGGAAILAAVPESTSDGIGNEKSLVELLALE